VVEVIALKLGVVLEFLEKLVFYDEVSRLSEIAGHVKINPRVLASEHIRCNVYAQEKGKCGEPDKSACYPTKGRSTAERAAKAERKKKRTETPNT